MFCANTSPVAVASRDLGEISPPILSTSTSWPRTAGGGVGARDVVVAAWDVGVDEGDGVAVADDDGAAAVDGTATSGAAVAEQPTSASAAHSAAATRRGWDGISSSTATGMLEG
jgi:hypothetical protein